MPLLYDWLTSRVLSWPHGALQWGAPLPPSLDDSSRRPFPTSSSSSMHTLFMAERTDDPFRDPNTLVQYSVRVIHELVNKPSDVAKPWIEDGNANDRDMNNNQDFSLCKRICHPGEVNAIRLISPTVLVTHTDSPKLFIWDMQRQPHRKPNEKQLNTPTCVLIGHEKNADYAIDVSPHGLSSASPRDPSVVSGGSDHHVLLWRVRDYETCGGQLQAAVCMRGSTPAGSANAHAAVGNARDGHSGVVEDVSFGIADPSLVVSVGRDAAMILWDVRDTGRPALKVNKAHAGDVNCCAVGGVDGRTIASGGADQVLRLWDVRKLREKNGQPAALKVFRGHVDQVTNVSWNRFQRDVMASGSDDGDILIWRVNAAGEDKGPKVGPEGARNGASTDEPKSIDNRGLLFRHVGHKQTPSKVTDLDWLPHATDRWCMASLSESQCGGSTVQLWRMSDLIHRPKHEVLEDLRRHTNLSRMI